MKKVSVKKLVEYLRDYESSICIEGNADVEIDSVSSYNNYKERSLTWMKQGSADGKKKMYVLILPFGVEADAEVKIFSGNPKFLFFKAVEWMIEDEKKYGVMPTANVMSTAQMERNVFVGYNTYIGHNVKIGENTVIEHSVVIEDNTIIGKNCVIKSGAVIGGRGFGYSKFDKCYHAVPHLGKVVIGNNVDIGNNTCIDRGTIDDTIIEDGVKIDNLCHIAHNVVIGKNSCIIAASTIAGSVRIGEGGYIAIGASILNQITIGEGALVGMGAVVTKDVPAEMVCAYSPAKIIRKRTQKDKEKY